MRDQFGRKIEYMRISVTDRCNLRCRYCMPEEGITQLAHEEILTFEEILTLTRIFSRMGINRIKITGGEPLVRKNVPDLISALKKAAGIEEVTMTTNGVLLGQFLPQLLDAGLDGVNISLDTLNPEKYKEITGYDRFSDVMDSIDSCINAEKLKVKVNTVTLDGINQDEIEELAGLARNRNLDIRFIEMMPMGLGRNFRGFTQSDILQRLEDAYGTAAFCKETLGNGPAVYYNFEGFKGKVGFISAMSHQFCADCNRVRLTAEGCLKPCLHHNLEADLKKLLRSGVDEEALVALIKETIYNKPRKHCFLTENKECGETYMWGIGG